jgi:hypothetical protein
VFIASSATTTAAVNTATSGAVVHEFHEDLHEELDDSWSASMSRDDDASLEARLDDAYESGQETYSEGNDLLSQVGHGDNNDRIMSDETAHNKRDLE